MRLFLCTVALAAHGLQTGLRAVGRVLDTLTGYHPHKPKTGDRNAQVRR